MLRSVAPKGVLSIGLRFIQRDGQRSQIGVKTIYDNPYPEWMLGRASDERLSDVVKEKGLDRARRTTNHFDTGPGIDGNHRRVHRPRATVSFFS